jgi:hypothetical protein
MSNRYTKTPAGRHEAQTHTQGLSRARRNLLLVINDSQCVDYWLSHLRGVTAADVAWLQNQGLITPSHEPACATPNNAGWKSLWHIVDTVPVSLLLDVLKAQAWAQFKGLRAYRFAQDADNCTDDTELRHLARAFVSGVQGEFGNSGVQQFTDALMARHRAVSRSAAPSWGPDSVASSPPRPTDGIALTPAVGATPVGFDAAECYRLSRWPCASALTPLGFNRLASLISHHALPLTQIALRGRVDVAVALGFVQAMQAHGVLEVQRQGCPPGLVAQPGARPLNEGLPGMMAPSQPNRASAPPAVSSGLLGRLRERLGLR